MKRDPNKYPKGWNRAKVESIIAYYDAQSEEDAIAEADAAWENSHTSLVRVPVDLVPEVEALVAKRSSQSKVSHRRKAS
jgi:hypothetical protein